MITLTFSERDLLACRFAVSPLWETVTAVRCLLHPQSHALHAQWIRRQLVSPLQLGVLPTLLPRRGYVPDFLTPPPAHNTAPSIDEEIERVRATPLEIVAAELARAAGRRAPGSSVRQLIGDPAAALVELTTVLHRCWLALLAPDWPRVSDLLAADVAYRGRQLTAGGLRNVFDDLRPEVVYDDTRIVIRGSSSLTRQLGGTGLLLMPSVFNWPGISVCTDPPWQPTLIYRARGTAALWLQGGPPPAALAPLLGPTRADILRLAGTPMSTTRLAREIALTPATVSVHLRVLADAGLVTSYRQGREVLYLATEAATSLIAAVRRAANPPGHTNPRC